ncbi:MAG TPA: hypothetical protein VGX28_14765 [Frankiaceae bacterium]|jgi:hypothetical protein|nr:hypothetical protein [Frankiaceae bacterium]
MATVVVVDPDNGGLDAMLAGLLSAVAEDPAKARLLDTTNGTVTIAVPDAEVEVGLRFGNGVCQVYPSAIPGSKVRIEMPSETLMSFSTIPLLYGMPSVLTPEGRAFTRQVLTRRVRISGLRHLGLVRRLNTLLSLT